MFAPIARSATAALLTLALPAQSRVWVVDDDATAGTLPDIGAALAVATAGDTVLVKDGNYPSFSVNQPVAVLGDVGARVTVRGRVSVRIDDPGQALVMRNLFVRLFTGASPIWIADTRAPILIEETDSFGWGSVLVEESANLVLTRCTLWSSDITETAACVARRSSAHVYGSSFTGSRGSEFYAPWPGAEIVGNAAMPAFFYAQGSRIASGGESLLYGHGLTALSTAGFGYRLEYLDSTFVEWYGLFGTALPISTTGVGSVRETPADAVDFSTVSPIREGGDTQLTFSGRQGTQVFVIFADTMLDAPLFLPQFGSSLLVAPAAIVPQGPIPSSGTLTVNLTAPALPPGIDASTAYVQTVTVSPSGELVLGPLSTLTILDARL
ncbi:MAG: hypothetical protein AAF628_19190 [Planctomycetota bacterium]